jgi:hypothetical protein
VLDVWVELCVVWVVDEVDELCELCTCACPVG